MKFKKKKDQSVAASILLRREDREDIIITRGGRGRTWEEERRVRGKRGWIKCVRRQGISTEFQEIEWKFIAVGDREL